MQTTTTLMRTLASIVIIAFSSWTVTDAEKVSPCCVEVSRSMEDITITGFRLQEKNLPCVKAVIFQTERGQFCIYPHQSWVRRKIMELRSQKIKKITSTSALLHQTTNLPTQNSTASTQNRKTTNHTLQ
ncbi:uncharacterized protein Hap1MRO34_001109 [Clarias gariepinus]